MIRLPLTIGALMGVAMAVFGCFGERRPLDSTTDSSSGRDGGGGAPTPGQGNRPDAAPITDAPGASTDTPSPQGDGGGPGDAPVPPVCSGGSSIAAHAAEVALATFSPDGRFIATLAVEELKLWSATDWSLIWTKGSVGLGALASAQKVAFMPDSSRLVVAGSPPRFLAVADGQPTIETLSNGRADTVAVSPDGYWIAGGCQCPNNGPRLWNVSTAKSLPPLGTQDEQSFAVAFSPDSMLLASRAAYSTAAGAPAAPGSTIWRLSDLSRVWNADLDPQRSTHFAYNTFSPDGTLLVSIRPIVSTADAADPFLVSVRRVSDGTAVGDLQVVGRPRQAVFSPDGKTMVIAAADGLHAYDTATWTSVRDVPGTFLGRFFA